MAATKETQYQRCLDLVEAEGRTVLGLMSNQVWHDDPRRLGFVLARYKFVAKLLSGCGRVLEVGCADAFGSRVVQQEVKALTAIDFDPIFVDDVKQRMDPHWPLECRVHDMLAAPLAEEFDGVYSIDVLEHISADKETTFVRNMAQSIQKSGVCIIGTPSLESQTYASPASKVGHVNCKTAGQLKESLMRFFHNVFIFSMNDEVVHLGYYPMAHYLFALCCHRKE